jgi:hypothetical protein
MSVLDLDTLARFKLELSDENQLVSEMLRSMLPKSSGGIILDVGAGLGDIAARAFPDRIATLIDILEFPASGNALHKRITKDFFDLGLNGSPVDIMLMSHVLQYIDEDWERLRTKIDELSPSYIVTVSNRPSRLLKRIGRWLDQEGIEHNPEKWMRDCPHGGFALDRRETFIARITCSSFIDLAEQIRSVIFDAVLSDRQLTAFSRWLGDRLPQAELIIPEAVSLYARKQ